MLGGLLLALAWPRDGFPGLALVGFIPFLFLEDHISRNRKDFHRFATLVYSFPGFLLWNGLTTWWIWNSTEIGAVLALLANSFFMAVLFSLYVTHTLMEMYVYSTDVNQKWAERQAQLAKLNQRVLQSTRQRYGLPENGRLLG